MDIGVSRVQKWSQYNITETYIAEWSIFSAVHAIAIVEDTTQIVAPFPTY